VTKLVSKLIGSGANTDYGMEMLLGLKPMTDGMSCTKKNGSGLIQRRIQ